MTDRRRRPAPKGTATGRGRDARQARRKGRPQPASRRGRRLIAGVVASVVLAGFLLIGVLPTRGWLSQRDETDARRAELERIRSEQEAYEERIGELDDPDEIEQIAREEHGLVLPGEQAFQIAPAAVPPVELPETWPFTGASDWLNR